MIVDNAESANAWADSLTTASVYAQARKINGCIEDQKTCAMLCGGRLPVTKAGHLAAIEALELRLKGLGQ
jgi:hypothetical protein